MFLLISNRITRAQIRIGYVLDKIHIIMIHDLDNIVPLTARLCYNTILTQSSELKASSQLEECVDISVWYVYLSQVNIVQ